MDAKTPIEWVKDISSLSIYERIDAAYIEIAAVKFQKSKKVITKKKQYKDDTEESYFILTIADILDAIRRIHGKYGIKVFFAVPEYDERKGEGITREASRSGTVWTHARGHISYTIIGRDTRDTISGVVPFEAQDSSDKLTNKIITNATRCLYRVLYSIDADEAQDQGEAQDPEEINVKTVATNKDRFFKNKEPKQEPVSESDDDLPKPRETLIKHILDAMSEPNAREVLDPYCKAHNIPILTLRKKEGVEALAKADLIALGQLASAKLQAVARNGGVI